MRIRYSALIVLLATSAVPSVGLAQVLTLRQLGNPRTLDHGVPVATVSLVDDLVVLGGARIVEDTYGEPFVLGHATLDRRIPSQARVVFTMTNPTEKPISLKDVLIYERTLLSASSSHLRGVTVGAPYMPLSAAGWGPGSLQGEELQPGARLTVEVPVSPLICGTDGCHADGFVVFVGRNLPHGDRPTDPRAWFGENRPPPAEVSGPAGRAWIGENPIFTRAFLALLSQAQQQTTSLRAPR